MIKRKHPRRAWNMGGSDYVPLLSFLLLGYAQPEVFQDYEFGLASLLEIKPTGGAIDH